MKAKRPNEIEEENRIREEKSIAMFIKLRVVRRRKEHSSFPFSHVADSPLWLTLLREDVIEHRKLSWILRAEEGPVVDQIVKAVVKSDLAV